MTITLANLDQATPQEVFDQVTTHLLKQNKKSMRYEKSRNFCAYRSGNLKCAVGCLIDDDEYLPEMEASDWNDLIDNGYVKATVHTRLITELQNTHDTSSPVYWPDRLRKIVHDYRPL